MRTVEVALYARVSTPDQNLDLQLREIREYCSRRGWQIVAEYTDAGISGMKASRPQLDQLMADAKRYRFNTVVVWKLDRFGRSLDHLVHSIQELHSLSIRFVAVTQGIDTDESNPMSRLLLHIMSAFAEFERDMIRERSLAGTAAYRDAYEKGHIGTTRNSRSGKNMPVGRPKAIFNRERALEMRQSGTSWRKIAKELGVPVTTVFEGVTEFSGAA